MRACISRNYTGTHKDGRQRWKTNLDHVNTSVNKRHRFFATEIDQKVAGSILIKAEAEPLTV